MSVGIKRRSDSVNKTERSGVLFAMADPTTTAGRRQLGSAKKAVLQGGVGS